MTGVRAALATGAAALAFYLATLAPSVGWGDAARLQLEVAMRGSTYWFVQQAITPSGDGWPFQYLGVGAWDHPLYVMIGQGFMALPWGEPAWRVSLLSAVAAALAIAAFTLAGERLSGDRRAVVVGAAALGVSHTFWFHATTAEVYTLHAFFMLALIGFTLVRGRDGSPRFTRTRCLLGGLGIANHVMLILTIAPIAALEWVWARRAGRAPGVRAWASAAVWFGLGSAPWWTQFLRMWRAIGLPAVLYLSTGMPALAERLAPDSASALAASLSGYAGWLLYQFTPVGVVVGVAGARSLRRRQPEAFALLLTLFVVHVAFSAGYQVPDRFAFHLPSYVVFSLAMVAGFEGVLARLPDATASPWPRRAAMVLAGAAVLAPIGVYSLAPRALAAAGLDDAALRIPPVGGRNGAAYFLDPNHRGEASAARFGRGSLDALAPSALVLAPKERDQETYLVLRYFQLVERRRPDVELDLLLAEPTSSVAEAMARRTRLEAPCRPVYWASLDPRWYPVDELRDGFDVVPEARLYRVRPAGHDGHGAACPSAIVTSPTLTVDDIVRAAMRKK